MTDSIELRGLRVVGRHGVLAEEHQRAQPFEVDLDLEVDLHRPGRSDALADTVDYGSVTAAVADVVAGEHCQLLERLAERIAVAAWRSSGGDGGGVRSVTVTVRKLRPPVPHDLASAGVRIHRQSRELSSDEPPVTSLPA